MEEKLYNNYLEALLHGDRVQCHSIIQDLVGQGVDIRDIYLHFFQRSLYMVGKMWETNKISVATEHLATAITEGLLALLYPQLFAAEHIGKKAVVTCSVNEYHQIGGKMVADIFELNGWDSHFLGANTPMTDLLKFVQETQPDVLALSLSISSNLPKLFETAQVVRDSFKQLDIIFGGQAFRYGGYQKILELSGTSYISTLDELENTIRG